MTLKRLHRILWLFAALLTGLLMATPAEALRVAFSPRGDSDRFAFTFDETRPDFSVKRTGKRQITVDFPAGFWNREDRLSNSTFGGAKLVNSVNISGDSLVINTKTDAFGYLRLNEPGRDAFVLQVFRDPIGARWKPESQRTVSSSAPPSPSPEKSPSPTPRSAPQSQPVSEPAAVTEPQQSEETGETASDIAAKLADVTPEPTERDLDDAPAAPEPPQLQTQPAQQAVPQPVPPAVPQQEEPRENSRVSNGQGETAGVAPVQAMPSGPDRPFYSVPYSVRTAVTPPPSSKTPSPDEQERTSSTDGEVRFQAMNRNAEDVKLSELGGPEGTVVPPVVQSAENGTGQSVSSGAVTAPPASVPEQTTPSPAKVAEVPESQTGNAVSGSVALPPGVQAGGTVTPPQASGTVVPPSQTSAVQPPPQDTTAPSPVPEVEESGQQPEQQSQPVAEAASQSENATESVDESSPEEVVLPEGVPEDQLTPDQKQLLAKNQMYDAQSLMFNGNLEGAKDAYDELLKKPYLTPEMREEILYAVADLSMQLYKDAPEGGFDQINDAYLKALNANLESNRVPRALLNLGLINLKAGNIPEAKAYFNILRNKYPDDQNIPAISYYWGEYYFRRGEYPEAADQLQYMIQKYPEHELVKPAAYMLAQALEGMGYDQQAFQVTDYIDKRWPDFYMQNPEFLMLAGGIEERVDKLDQAKDHYFTYYNLNPEFEHADIALAKIGDLYLKLKQQKPAKEIYEKAAKDYPESEGGLISKMRLAEEGIYDDPTLVQMSGVFDRPYNLRPVNIYKDIVKKHPESPLAPVAQLKLAMWYAFHDQYADALSAAQDFLDLFPESPLAKRARSLGDGVFVQAVPELIKDENYTRVVRYWEDYEFIGEGDTKVDDNTKLMVATAYWKLDEPAKALALLEPYLDKQIPDVSNKALDLAVNIYLGEYNWDAIDKLVKHAEKDWKLDPRQMRQLNYARAMSLQNMGEEVAAVPLWARLAQNPEVDPSFRGYAMYYMAKNANKKQDLRRVFLYSQEALALLLQTDGDPEKIKDAVQMSISATERSGRYEEALKWAREYDKYITPDHPEWAPTRLKLARIYRKAGAINEWKKLLQDIVDKKPNSLQADLARSELETHELEMQAQEYAPSIQ